MVTLLFRTCGFDKLNKVHYTPTIRTRQPISSEPDLRYSTQHIAVVTLPLSMQERKDAKMGENGQEPLIEVRDVRVYFYLDEGVVRAVEGVSFDIERGKTLGVVGESGCGKSVTSQAIMQIVPPPGKIVSGDIFYHRYGRDGSSEKIEITNLDPRGPEIRNIRGNEIAKIFQEPMTSLSPVHTIGNQIMEAIVLHQEVDKTEAREKAIDIFFTIKPL